ncbi:MAG: DNA polymerase III subunit alpha [Firmicutes bacterium]|nr:DNA polymerase III subunit alpha [Alicyclobacillaceae bacterium]MCL6496901.1 DNA polymerase III subunit alpha [Bacillota bacterium]
MAGVHLHVHSAFSFLEGTAWPQRLLEEAARQAIEVVALTDLHRVSGVVPFLEAAAAYGVKGVVGAEVTVAGWGRLVLLAAGDAGYRALSEVLQAAHLHHPRGAPAVEWEDLERWGPELVALTGDRSGVMGRAWWEGGPRLMEERAHMLQRVFPPGRLYLEMTASELPGDRQFHRLLADLGAHRRIPLVATNAVHYPTKADFGLFDLFACIRLGQPVEAVHPERRLNAENYLKRWEEMAAVLAPWPQALRNALALAERLEPPNLLRRRHSPRFPLPAGGDPQRYLTRLVEAGVRRRYGARWRAVMGRVRQELAVIADTGFADYFLVVWDVARWARRQGIRFAGRGSAADSVVAYALGITAVDAYARGLQFERFMSRERRETPDIDIDFDARRRDEVVEYVRRRYGADRVARVATYQTYRRRLAVREIGKALGFPSQELDRLAKSLPEAPLGQIRERWEAIPELRRFRAEAARMRELLRWAEQAEGLPRHLGTHLGGVVISGEPVVAVGPCERSAKGEVVLAFDKRDVERLGLLKLDLLALRAFTAVEAAVGAVRRRAPEFSYEAIPAEDPATYRRLQQGESIGVFQLESPAQRALALRLRPECWEDLVASLALIRPGPIKGNMVDPFVNRRRGREPVRYPHPDLEPILAKTYGVVLFQEQVIAIASTLAGFTPGEADALRRVMTHGRSHAEMARIGEQFKAKAIARGVEPAVAETVFQQLAGYASYGFNEAHAAAFAETAYRTAYLLEHYPAEYFLGLLNAQPMGYYPVDILLVEARRRGVVVEPIDINRSAVAVTQPAPGRLRLGLGMVPGLGSAGAAAVVQNRPAEGYRHPVEVLERAGLDEDQVATLIRIGAFDGITQDRTGLLASLWARDRLGLLPPRGIEPWPWERRVWWDYRYLGFGQRAQFLAPWRRELERQGFLSVAAVRRRPLGQPVRMVATVYRPHRPPTRSGRLVVFLSLYDETGVLEAWLGPQGYQRFGQWLFGPRWPWVTVIGHVRPQGLAIDALRPWRPPRMLE